jgi:hypothetical protein
MIVFGAKIAADSLFVSLVATQANLLYPQGSRRFGFGDWQATGVREAKKVDFLCT